ncbi:hypothetical protein F5884DRAFT_381720 [Xylogone sp. PMI_703]|nr:hypothetical protein F5884DRAFT_381720 [Xylogone sp. PMI_703]
MSHKACFDDLPNELKVAILLQMHNTPTLQALVRSSPSYHQAYIGQRRLILSTVLLRDLPVEVLPDAIAVQYAFKIPFDSREQRKKDIESTLSQYKSQRTPSAPDALETIEIDTLTSLARLQSVVVDITSDFYKSALALCPFSNGTIESLSHNEKRRIYRALYRFELYCVIFNERMRLFDNVDQTIIFFSMFKPWEMEELACVRDYIMRSYFEFLEQCASELTRLHPSKDFYKDSWRSQNAEYFMTLGLSYLRRVIQTPSDSERAHVLANDIRTSYGFLMHALEVEPYDWMYQTEAYDAYADEEPLHFESDDDVEGPNAAWAWANGYKAEIWYFRPGRKNVRKWAYVMWDVDRLRRWKVLDMDVKEVENLGNAPKS